MEGPVSTLKLASAMARYAGHANEITAGNIARGDMPGAVGNRIPSFAETIRRFDRSLDPKIESTGQAINLETEMLDLAGAKGTHESAVAVWKSTLKMMRLAIGAPQS